MDVHKNTVGSAVKFTDLDMANKLLNSIADISRVIVASKQKFQGRINRILEIILDYLKVEQGSIMLLENNFLVVKAASRADLIGVKQSLSEDSVAAWVAKNGAPLFVPDITTDSRFSRRGNGQYKKKALLSVPIINNGKVIGVINATDKSGGKDLYKDDIAYLLEFTSLLLWLIVEEDLHARLKKQKSILNKRNKELKRQEKIRADLSRTLVHDLKGPLSEVVANLDILSYSIGEEEKEFVQSAQLGCDRAVRMVSNLVSVGKIEDGKLRLILEDVEPGSLIKESVSAIKGLAKIKNVQIQIALGPGIVPLKMDRILIFRVLQNLLTNALEYTPPGSTVQVGCSLTRDGKGLNFYVQDQGEGIPVAQQKTIFEKYARISEAHNHLVGMGLGLFFCKLAIVQHRGQIDVENAPDRGSIFHFTLPKN